MFVLFITQLMRLVERLRSRKPVNNTSLARVVNPTERPKPVRNRFVTEVFGGAFLLPLEFNFLII